MPRRLAKRSILLGCAALSSVAWGELPTLSEIRVAYQELQFEKCLTRVDASARFKATNEEAAELALYRGLCQLGLGRRDRAMTAFKAALKIDSSLQLPPLQAPKVREAFEEARSALGLPKAPEPVRTGVAEVPVAPPKPDAGPVELAPRPEIVKTEPATVSLDAGISTPKGRSVPGIAVPLGAGVLAAATGVVAAVFGFQALDLQNQANRAMYYDAFENLRGRANQAALFANVLWGAAALLAVGGVVSFFLMD